jgi:hypothetical protein
MIVHSPRIEQMKLRLSAQTLLISKALAVCGLIMVSGLATAQTKSKTAAKPAVAKKAPAKKVAPKKPVVKKPAAKPAPVVVKADPPENILLRPLYGTWFLRDGEAEVRTTKIVFERNGTFVFSGSGWQSKGSYGLEGNNLVLRYTHVDGVALQHTSRRVLPLDEALASFRLDKFLYAKAGHVFPVVSHPVPEAVQSGGTEVELRVDKRDN